MKSIDINADIGESYGAYKMGNDEKLIPLISSGNIACGFHAGDPSTMRKTIEICRSNKVAIGAHPGYQDLAGFGRRSFKLSVRDFEALMLYQIGSIKEMSALYGLKVNHVKPHGALYNDIASSLEFSEIFANLIKKTNPDLIVFGMSGSKTEEVFKTYNLNFAREIFADRNYNQDGSLVSRTEPHAVLTDHQIIVDRLVQYMKTGRIKTADGQMLTLSGDTLCIHGDHENSYTLAEMLRRAFEENKITIKAYEG